MMKRSRYSDEQIIYAMRQAKSGTPVADVCRRLAISDAAFCTSGRRNTRTPGAGTASAERSEREPQAPSQASPGIHS
jgi:putative transposase